MRDHRLSPTVCPYCDKLLDGASGMDHDAVPEPDDLTVCIYCAQFLQFNPDMSLRKVSQRELNDIPRGLRQKLEVMARAVRSIDRRDMPSNRQQRRQEVAQARRNK